ncbi:hypothetical protein SO802_018951 [Lithocarpus litseifolius]|uniref:Uncharacterized protein n=1 Tax=Lithocarpus litseifolius TaxID=425828 RepID=A0AAW2CPF0_9ROSI
MELTGRRMTWICSYVLLQILFISSYAASRSIVKTLPGFDGDLPFKLETGYIGVGEMDDVQLFYYFVESQRKPSRDPLLVWLTGGPGCSSFKPFFYGIGPLSFDYISSERGLPTLHLNSDTWTKGLNILYIDAPVGSRFSYSKSLEGYHSPFGRPKNSSTSLYFSAKVVDRSPRISRKSSLPWWWFVYRHSYSSHSSKKI